MAPDRLPAFPSEQDRRPGRRAVTAARMSNFRITPNALSHKLKLHQLQIFERVLARRSLSRAASEMHLTQPTVTKAIHDLEAFFGATLFERSNRGVTPTELALVLGRRVHAMMAEIRYMADDIDAVLGGASGHVVVGTLIAASAKLLPEAIARLMTEHPGIQVTVREGPSAQLLPALATGDVDIVVGRLPGADMASISGVAVDHHKLYREDLCLVAGARHPLAGAARVTLAELADHIWILPAPTSPLRASIERSFFDAGVRLPTRHVESLSLLTNIGILMHSDALALMPYDAAAQFLAMGVLTRLPTDAFGAFGDVGYSIRADRPLTPACLRLVDYLKQIAAQRPASA
ncbi:LysR substrate-binding domain-containing protein [Achromobacter insuavis]|uniref:LysR substrate-binding domain-containing protein n=1 Tax=Achromobacter insuavis TaxID=1287735 RepID=UPI001465CF15|nr:HTH-type transcriptional regulator GbpR [Achromobacter insuavis]